VAAATPLLRRLASLGDAAAAPSRAQDAQILQLVLQLEHTQVAFYEDALRQASLDAELNNFARSALDHERQHLAAIEKALGRKKGPRRSSTSAARRRAPLPSRRRRSSSRTSPSPATTARPGT
jgi:hypothetical protein